MLHITPCELRTIINRKQNNSSKTAYFASKTRANIPAANGAEARRKKSEIGAQFER
jgi:hypothetical protein